jgi:hypothetical protein
MGEADQARSAGIVSVLVVVGERKKKLLICLFLFWFSTVTCLVGSALRGKYCYIRNLGRISDRKPDGNSARLYIYITVLLLHLLHHV